MDFTLLLTAVLTLLASVLVIIQSLRGFDDWKFSEKVAAAQILLPFGAAAFALNALFGSTLERPSKIAAAIFTLCAGLASIVKQVAANMEAHPGTEEMPTGERVSLGAVTRKLLFG